MSFHYVICILVNICKSLSKAHNYILILSLIFLNLFNGFSQHEFKMMNNVDKQTFSFSLLSNLIVFPIEVNGKELNFILDSGVGQTILFNLNPQDSINLKNEKVIKLKGLGNEEAVDAVLSKGNKFKLKDLVSYNQDLYVISNDNFDLSSKMGLTIHGIIGYELLKDFVVKINYSKKRISFFKPSVFKPASCKKCKEYNLEFYKFKPYINVGVKLDPLSEKITPVKLLIDSGGSDAMWLFENTHEDLKPPIKFFDDFLGEGLSGSVYGKRSKIKSLVIGDFEIKNPTVSYPDSVSVAEALHFKDRNGSMGASVLKRFVVFFDYKKAKLYLRKGSNFKEPFRYNMSGIELAHNGKILVKERDKGAILTKESGLSTGNTFTISYNYTLDYNYKFTFKPTYVIQKLRIGSPAHRAGLELGDVLIKINGKYTFNLKLEEIVENFYQKENSKTTVVVQRHGVDYQYEFRLEDMLK